MTGYIKGQRGRTGSFRDWPQYNRVFQNADFDLALELAGIAAAAPPASNTAGPRGSLVVAKARRAAGAVSERRLQRGRARCQYRQHR